VQQPEYKWVGAKYQLEYLMLLRDALVQARAYQVLDLSDKSIYAAAQADGYDLGRLKMLDELISTMRVADAHEV
jgi:hypothetical protein